jgi:CheY-specific phosphatase CheX
VNATDNARTSAPGGIECVVEAAAKTLQATCGVAIEPLADQAGSDGEAAIVAVISLVGDVEWAVFLVLPRETAAALAAQFAGFEVPFDSPDMADAVGELCNILGGQVKALLDQRGMKANISLPTIMRADGLEVLIQQGAAAEKRCFASPAGKLWTGLTVCSQPADGSIT